MAGRRGRGRASTSGGCGRRIAFGADGDRLLRPVLVRGLGVRAHLGRHRHRPGWFGDQHQRHHRRHDQRLGTRSSPGASSSRSARAPCRSSFGSRDKALPPPMPWTAFVAKYLEVGGRRRPRHVRPSPAAARCRPSTAEPEGAPTSDGTPPCPYQVFAEFEMHLTTTVPATAVDVGGHAAGPGHLELRAPAGVGLAPDGRRRPVLDAGDLAGASSTGPPGSPRPASRRLGANLRAGTADPAGSRLGTDSFPLGVWGAREDPGPPRTLPSATSCAAGKQVILVAGSSATTVGPPDRLPPGRGADRRPLPLLATGATRAACSSTSAPRPADRRRRRRRRTAPSRSRRASSSPTAADARGARGGHSALARAAYRQRPRRAAAVRDPDRRAGPGQRRATATRPVLDAPVPPARACGAPFVAGYLTAGVGARGRATRTTVWPTAPQATTRARPSPSVQGRIGLHVPPRSPGSPHPRSPSRAARVVATRRVPRTDAVGTIRSSAGAGVRLARAAVLVAGLGGLAGRSAPAATAAAPRAARGGPRRTSAAPPGTSSCSAAPRRADRRRPGAPPVARRQRHGPGGRRRRAARCSHRRRRARRRGHRPARAPGSSPSRPTARRPGRRVAGWHAAPGSPGSAARRRSAAGCVAVDGRRPGQRPSADGTPRAAVVQRGRRGDDPVRPPGRHGGRRPDRHRAVEPRPRRSCASSAPGSRPTADGAPQPPVARRARRDQRPGVRRRARRGRRRRPVEVHRGVAGWCPAVVGAGSRPRPTSPAASPPRPDGRDRQGPRGRRSRVRRRVERPPPATPPRAAKRATAKKATATKATAKKATATKATAKKATAKKATAKKATAKKAARGPRRPS